MRYLKGIGPKRAVAFNDLGLSTVEDLLYYFPRRYEDRTNFSRISKLTEGSASTIKAKVLAKGGFSSWRRRGFSIVEIAVGDDSGRINCVWFNQPYLRDYFKVGDNLILYGKVERYAKELQMSSPEFEVVTEESDESLNTGRIVPVYKLPVKVSQRSLRSLVKFALDEYLVRTQDFLSYDIRSRNNLLNLAKALINIHFPESEALQKSAYERLSFEEFFLFQLPLALRKLAKKQKKGIAHETEGGLLRVFLDGLSFKLTTAQEKVLNEIKLDMRKPYAMQRLLQGDVGSGKTVVAFAACVIAIQGGYQAAFMAPTEILAKQHFEKVSSWFMANSSLEQVRIRLITGSENKKNKEKIYSDIKEGHIDLVIGTHALLQAEVNFKNLGLVVIDEQHKFGVGQRALLPAKGRNPDCLIMTATPIPRTLAITLYGDLDISVIDELPPGRKPVKTVSFEESLKPQAYRMVKEELKKGNQAYIIYPVIEDSYALDMSGAKKMYAQLKEGELKGYRLGLIHGKLKQNEQDSVMLKFKNKELDVLVSTTVLEVGIDVPDATCMVIEHAERFGLSQLHQLRGRIGRSSKESVCILITGAKTEESPARLEAMIKYGDGFKIAEQDLKIRGPGEFFGSRQSGLTELKIGDPLTQMHLLKKAREEAIRIMNQDPQLKEKQNTLLREKLLKRFPEYENLMLIG